jgi:tetratricopeptide (TPR) repeat protein
LGPNRGLAHRKRDELNEAVADYSQAIRLDPKYVPAYANRGYVFYMLKDYDSALVDFDKILELDPQNTDAKKSREIIQKSLSSDKQ